MDWSWFYFNNRGWRGVRWVEGYESDKLVLTHERNRAIHIQNLLQLFSTIFNPVQPFSTHFNQPNKNKINFNPLLPTSPIYQPYLLTKQTALRRTNWGPFFNPCHRLLTKLLVPCLGNLTIKSMSSQSSNFWNSGLPHQQKFQLFRTYIPFIFQPTKLQFETQIKYLKWAHIKTYLTHIKL